MSEDEPVSLILSDEQGLPVNQSRVVEAARQTALAEGAVGEISILLVDASTMAEIHSRYLGEPGPTDVLAFPIDGLVKEAPDRDGPEERPPVMIGEIVLCPEVAQQQAPGSLEEELDLLVVHGVLHLLGYDHDTQQAAARMRAREQKILGGP